MIQNLKNISFILLVCFYTAVFSQNDTIEKKKNVYKFELDKRKSVDGLIIGKGEKQISFYDLLSKEGDPTPQPKPLDYYLSLGKSNSSQDLISMANRGKVDDDVLVKRSFNGQDTSNPKMTSHADLGSFESSTKYVRIEFVDHGLVDGDIVRIYLNEKIVHKHITLTGVANFIQLEMKKGYNRIDFSALNQGYVGPNTAAFMVYDDKGRLVTAKAWNLMKNQNATLGIIKN